MTNPSSASICEIIKRLDERVRHVDEERWLSSRYASQNHRQSLIVLYAFYYELARVRLIVTDPAMGAIRFQWWRDALEELRLGQVRQHDVALALEAQIKVGTVSIDGLLKLIDGFEDAFEQKDRGLEPEGKLAAIASHILVGTHRWGEPIRTIAPHWAALRRGESVGFGDVFNKAPKGIRPAVAHFRLRKVWAVNRKPSPLAKRVSILLGILFGRV